MLDRPFPLVPAAQAPRFPISLTFCPVLTDAAPTHSDYINPIDLCNRLNTYIIPEVAVHGFLTFMFLINGYWLPLILNLPLLGWNIKKYVEGLSADSGRMADRDLGFSTTPISWTRPRFSGSLTCTRRYGTPERRQGCRRDRN